MRNDKIKVKLRELLLKKEWDKAEHLLVQELRSGKCGVRMLREFAWGMLECDKVDKAIRYGELAYQAAPNNKYVIWEFANILSAGGDDKKAIHLFKRLLRIKPETISTMSQGESEKWARALKNDCRFRIGLAYYHMGKAALARKWFSEYIKRREAGISSEYSIVEAKSKVATLDNVKLIEGLIRKDTKEGWMKAQPLIKRELRKSPNDIWLLTQLSGVYFAKDKYEKSLEIIDKAFKLSPRDPFVLWRRAESLDFCDCSDEAVELYKRIIRMGIEGLTLDKPQAGIRWAESLINDCICSVGLCYYENGKIALGRKWLKRHLANRRPGLPSIYFRSKLVAVLQENALK